MVLFEKVGPSKKGTRPSSRNGLPKPPNIEYRYLTEFQSHESENVSQTTIRYVFLDFYLKNVEIEEKMNAVKWCRVVGNSLSLISANDKTIKFWKVSEKSQLALSQFNTHSEVKVIGRTQSPKTFQQKAQKFQIPNDCDSLRFPKIICQDKSLVSQCRGVYDNHHVYHINSLTVNSDGETFLSADDLRINLWNLEVSNQSYCLVDLKPKSTENLSEFHPRHCNILTYGSSKGILYLADKRVTALCEKHTKVFLDDNVDMANRGYFSEIIASISDAQFTPCGRYLYTRDYMTVKLWDLNMDRGPVKTYEIHEGLREQFCELFENDCIFDMFDVCLDPKGGRFATGSYDNSFTVFSGQPQQLQATRDPMRRKGYKGDPSLNEDEFTLKLLHMSWHPKTNLIAAASSNSLYIYSAKPVQNE